MRLARPAPLTTRPTVSVVIPCYNYGHYLQAAVVSALDQPGVQVDVLIVDDASEDDSLKVAHRLAAADDRVGVLAHGSNMGHIATYNDGLRRAGGSYVVLLSADDMLAPGSLARSTALLEAMPDVAFVYGFAPSFRHVPPPMTRQRPRSWTTWEGTEWIDRICRRGNNVVMNPEVVMRTSVLTAIGGYDAGQPQAADMYLWMRAAMSGRVGRVNGVHQAYYRVHEDNMHLTEFAGVLRDLRARRMVFDAIGQQVHSRAGHRWQRRSSRAIAREAVRIGCCVADGLFETAGPPPAVYGDEALSVWPEIKRTRLWRSMEARIQGTYPGWRRRLFALDWDLRNRLRWQRWMRFGT